MKIFTLFIPLLFLFGCSSSTPEASRNTLKLSFHEPPMTIDPRKNADPYSSHLIFMLYDGLTNIDSEGNLVLAVAESVEVSEDLKSYLFHLRETRWSNGHFVTAYDFEYSWKKLLEPSFPSRTAGLFFPIKNAQAAKKGDVSPSEIGVKAIDKWTLLVNLEHPTPYFLELISFASFFPVPSGVDEKEVNWDQNPKEAIYNGPLVVDDWIGHKEIKLKSNPYYWDKNHIHVDNISIAILPDENLTLNLFEKGELDFIGGITSPIPIDAIPTLKRSPDLIVQPIAGSIFFTFNTQDPIFSNKNLRKAFFYAINRESLIEHVTQLDEDIAYGLIPNAMKKAPMTQKIIKKFDGELAKAYFLKACEELDIDPSKFPTIHCPVLKSELYLKIAQTIQQQWRESLGIKVVLEQLDMKVMMDRLARRDYQISLFSWVAQYNDPMNILERLFSDTPKNYSGWINQSFIDLVNQSCNTSNRRKRLKIMDQAEAIVMEELPIAPLFHIKHAYLKSRKLKNVSLTPTRGIRVKWITLEENDE